MTRFTQTPTTGAARLLAQGALAGLCYALCACTTTPKAPDPTPIVSQNSTQLNLNPTTSSSYSGVTSQSVNLQDRVPDSEARKKARLRMQLAVSYYQDGRYSTALDELKISLQADPTFPDAYDILALVYQELGDKQLAEQNFQHALQLAPNDSDVNNNYGWYLCQNDRIAEAMPHFVRATQNPLFTQASRAFQNAGLCAMHSGDLNQAEEFFRKSFERDPVGGLSALALAQIYFQRKDFERARFYVSLVNKGGNPGPESLWLGIRVEHALGHGPEELSLGTQLTRSFPNAPETQAFAHHDYGQ